MSTFRQGDYGAATAAVDLAANTCVVLDANNHLAQATTGAAVDGVVEKGSKAGDTVSFAWRNGDGTFKVKLGGTVTKGQLLTAGAGGLAVAAATGNIAFGYALSAGNANDVVEYVKTDRTA